MRSRHLLPELQSYPVRLSKLITCIYLKRCIGMKSNRALNGHAAHTESVVMRLLLVLPHVDGGKGFTSYIHNHSLSSSYVCTLPIYDIWVD